MKARWLLFVWFLALLFTPKVGRAQTLNWGSEVFTDMADSSGTMLDASFVFQLGAFVNGFVPNDSNVADWYSNWMVFDQASFDPGIGYFTSTVTMNDDGSSSYNPGYPGFEGLEAYLWIRNGTDPIEGTEWLLTRATSWVFPAATAGCCDNAPPLEWSVTDLESTDVPLWGSQNGVPGSGVWTNGGPFTLQTYTFVPEPTSVVLVVLSSVFLLRRRRECA